MWTTENRRAYERCGLRCPSDLTDMEWRLVEALIPPAKRGGRRRTVDVRAVLNGIFYVLSTGCQWRALPLALAEQAPAAGVSLKRREPKDLPPRSTVHEYLQLWEWNGTLARLHHALFMQAQELPGKEASPSVAIIDSLSRLPCKRWRQAFHRNAESQSVKSAEKGALASTRRDMTRGRRSTGRSGTFWSIRSA